MVASHGIVRKQHAIPLTAPQLQGPARLYPLQPAICRAPPPGRYHWVHGTAVGKLAISRVATKALVVVRAPQFVTLGDLTLSLAQS